MSFGTIDDTIEGLVKKIEQLEVDLFFERVRLAGLRAAKDAVLREVAAKGREKNGCNTKRISMSDGRVFATNDSGKGVFILEADGSYHQLVGNDDTPQFRNPVQFRQWLRRHLDVRGCRIVDWRWTFSA